MGVSGDEPEERPSCQSGCESQKISFSIVSLHCQLPVTRCDAKAGAGDAMLRSGKHRGKCLCGSAEVERTIMNLYSGVTIHRHRFIWQFVSVF